MPDIVLIAHNLRSSHNVGSLFRTAEGLGVTELILTGYTPYPKQEGDSRLPHIALKIDHQIHKTALDAEQLLPWRHRSDIVPVITELKSDGYVIAALEQAQISVSLPTFVAPAKLAIIVGREVEGLESEILKLTDIILEIPMVGKKESFNVVQAAAMAIYHCQYVSLSE